MEDRIDKINIPNINLMQRTHHNTGLVSITSLPATVGGQITSGVLIQAMRVEANGLTKQALWLTDETFGALIKLVGEYLGKLGESCEQSTSPDPSQQKPPG